MKAYDHKAIEPKWQQRWEESRVFATPETPGSDKAYILDMFPYPSGYGLHVGHLLPYTGTDILARAMRMQGKAVLHPMGWDSFGLPAENFAIKTGVHPAISTKQNTVAFKRQLQQIGTSYDWSKELTASNPEYYKWTQWLFQLLYKRGLAYRKEGMVNWCPSCQTVLANEQVVGGRCERCSSTVEQRMLNQWYFKITDYTERLLKDLDELDWPEKIKTMQRNWIGKSEGAELSFAVATSGEEIKVFTTRLDTIYGVTYLVLAPEHPLLATIVTDDKKVEVSAYQEATKLKSELERQFLEKTKSGVFTGAYAINPINGQQIPIWTADYVLSGYGTGAIMAVPAHDERDYEFAIQYDLPITQVVSPQFIQTDEPGVYRPGEPKVTHDGVIVLVKHWSEDKYIGLRWKQVAFQTLLTGQIDDGMTPEETVLKEIREETGYLNAEITKKLGVVDGLFYHELKKTNKLVHGHMYVATLKDDAMEQIAADEDAKHELLWMTPAELAGFLKADTHQFTLSLLESGWKVNTMAGSLVNSDAFDGLERESAIDAIVAKLGEAAKRVTTYRLRDWLVSRQRFWGAPIPIAYDVDGKEYLIPETELPVELPMDVAFAPTGQSPLDTAEAWKKVVVDGKDLIREADTLDTFVCSSWYYLRFPNPSIDDKPFDPEAVKTWLPVNTYVGGAEHAVLHLLYSRFITKVLFDEGLISFKEPFQSLRNQGMILGPDHQKMSKSKGNVINQEDVIAEFGADTLRVYEMFMGPFDQEKPWNTKGIIGVRRFLEKVVRLSERATAIETSAEELRAITKAIKGVGEDIVNFSFNTCISKMMESVNSLLELPAVTKETYLSLIKILSPFAPHLSEELWESAGQEGFCSVAAWPSFDEKHLVEDSKEYPVQINGKIRAKISMSAAASSEEVEVAAKTAVASHLYGKEIVKVIVVPGRLVSIVIR